MRDKWRRECPWGACGSRVATGDYPDDYCYTMSLAEVDQLTPMTLHFGGGVTLAFILAVRARRKAFCRIEVEPLLQGRKFPTRRFDQTWPEGNLEK